ncbi:hypothetical protein N7494_002677 [Penicillium frequentans]|uniref:Uncharacterized protein n=1 Tax=Penicillium frequentans TaxID=3151616 RepID=A0AAD6GIZ7_9EURO|nr:hypothetical protein N7494_002677 [Penicillium glabrum]
MGYLTEYNDLWRNTPYMPEVTDMLETTDSFGMPDVTSPSSMPTYLLEVPPQYTESIANTSAASSVINLFENDNVPTRYNLPEGEVVED